MKEIIIYKIYDNLVQSAAEANLGRELTETELKRLKCVFIDSLKFNSTVYEALVEAATEAMDDSEWKEYDEKYKDASLKEVFSQFPLAM
jgi:hypothetical protein